MLILIADDHALVREGLRYALRDLTPEVRFQEASDAMQVRALIERSPDVDLLLLDLVMPGSNGFELLTELCQRRPELPVVVLSGSEDPVHMRKALDLGAAGFIPKTSSAEVMLSALRLVLAGGIYVPSDMLRSSPSGAPADAPPAPVSAPQSGSADGLTNRQREVLRQLGEGKSNKQIARVLDLSDNTVKIHVAAILRVLKAENRTQAVIIARGLGLLGEE